MNSTVQLVIIILNELKAAEPGQCVPAYKMVAKHNLSAAFTDQICRKLRQKGLIKSNRGPAGGYSITEAGKDLTMLDLMTMFSKWKTSKESDITAPYINKLKTALADIQI